VNLTTRAFFSIFHPHLFFFFIIQCIYSILLGFFMDSINNWSMFGPLIEMREFLVCFYSCELCTLLVLQWWFCNKLGFGDFGGFVKLKYQKVVPNLLILRETWSTFDKNPLRRLEVWTLEIDEWFLHNGYHNHQWLSYPLLKSYWNNFNVIVIYYHLKLVEGMHIFCLDQTLLDLEVCNFTFIYLNVLTRSI